MRLRKSAVFPAAVGKICTTDAGFRTAFRQIPCHWGSFGSFGGRKPANICSFTGGSRMKTIGPHQVAMLIEPPREAFSPPLVVDGPGLKHATRADNPWNAAHDREPGETMVMRQPNPVVMDDICSPKCVQGFALGTGDAQQVAVRWQNRRGQCRTIRSPYRYPSSGLRQCQGQTGYRMRRAAIRRQQACYSKKNSHRFTRFTIQADLEPLSSSRTSTPSIYFYSTRQAKVFGKFEALARRRLITTNVDDVVTGAIGGKFFKTE